VAVLLTLGAVLTLRQMALLAFQAGSYTLVPCSAQLEPCLNKKTPYTP
jgi:hypothetical protein